MSPEERDELERLPERIGRSRWCVVVGMAFPEVPGSGAVGMDVGCDKVGL